MQKIKKKQLDLFFEIYEKKNIPNPFREILISNGTLKPVSKNNPSHNIANATDIYSVFFIPDYFKPKLDSTFYNEKRVRQFFKGYAINLKDFKTVDEYLKNRFRSNAKAVRKKVRRLETCFTIESKMFYGSISKEDYDFYISCLYNMLVSRFDQRNDVNLTLLNWKKIEDLFFQLINEKKASLFVIYEDQKPIVISLSHHFEGHLFSAISSYDINFSKFSPGTIEIYKKLEWCIANDHFLYEMGMGDLSYKKEWCNHIYNFEHSIIYPKKGFLVFIRAQIEIFKISAKEAVYKLVYKKYKKFKEKLKKETLSPIEIITEDLEDIKEKELLKINFQEETYDFLKNNIYDFCYSSITHISEISVYKDTTKTDTFFVQGNSKTQKIQFKNRATLPN